MFLCQWLWGTVYTTPNKNDLFRNIFFLGEVYLWLGKGVYSAQLTFYLSKHPSRSSFELHYEKLSNCYRKASLRILFQAESFFFSKYDSLTFFSKTIRRFRKSMNEIDKRFYVRLETIVKLYSKSTKGFGRPTFKRRVKRTLRRSSSTLTQFKPIKIYVHFILITKNLL